MNKIFLLCLLCTIHPVYAETVRQGAPDGQAIFKANCAACHTSQLMGAPMLGDKKKWEPLIAQGMDVLVNHAAQGIRSMPPRGGNPSLSNADLKSAIEFMVSRSK